MAFLVSRVGLVHRDSISRDGLTRERAVPPSNDPDDKRGVPLPINALFYIPLILSLSRFPHEFLFQQPRKEGHLAQEEGWPCMLSIFTAPHTPTYPNSPICIPQYDMKKAFPLSVSSPHYPVQHENMNQEGSIRSLDQHSQLFIVHKLLYIIMAGRPPIYLQLARYQNKLGELGGGGKQR